MLPRGGDMTILVTLGPPHDTFFESIIENHSQELKEVRDSCNELWRELELLKLADEEGKPKSVSGRKKTKRMPHASPRCNGSDLC
jgi:hypothetical protein